MSFIKKSNRKYRQRVTQEDSDEEKIEKNGEESGHRNGNKVSTIVNKSIKVNDSYNDLDDGYSNKPKAKSQVNSRLSFQDEEEDCDVFKVKKSSYSQRIAKQLEKNKKNKEKKKIENKETKPNNDDEMKVIWVKNVDINVKTEPKEPKEELKILSGDDMNAEVDEECDEYTSNEPFYHFRGALERGVIPDAKTIYALKKQRQMARDVTEFIPLEDDEELEDNTSRLIREDANDKSDDDEDEDKERISFAFNKDKVEKEKAREAFMLAQEEDESDDELERWEREQIRKGVRMPSIQLIAHEHDSNFSKALFSDNLTVIDMDIDRPTKSKKSTIPSSLLERNKITIEDIVERLNNKITSIRESLESHERELTNVKIEMDASKQAIDSCTKKASMLAAKYESYQSVYREHLTKQGLL